jgi:hypothetical protein
MKCPQENQEEYIEGHITINPESGRQECHCPTCNEAQRLADENISMMSLPCKAINMLKTATCSLIDYAAEYPMGTPMPFTEGTEGTKSNPKSIIKSQSNSQKFIKQDGGKELTPKEWYHYFMNTNGGQQGSFKIVKNKNNGKPELKMIEKQNNN